MQIAQIVKAIKCIKVERRVCFFIINALIPLIINKITLNTTAIKTDKTSKFGVHGPDLNFPDTSIETTINIVIK